MSIQRAKAETTSTEFLLWQEYLLEQPNEFNPQFWYLASIAYEIFCLPFRVWGKEPPKNLGIKDWLLKFVVEEDKPRLQMTEEDYLAKAKASEEIWLSIEESLKEASPAPVVHVHMPPVQAPSVGLKPLPPEFNDNGPRTASPEGAD